MYGLIFIILETVAADTERGLFFLEAYFCPLIEIHMAQLNIFIETARYKFKFNNNFNNVALLPTVNIGGDINYNL